MSDRRPPTTRPPAPPGTTPASAPRPLERREWFAARMALARRRSARFAQRWTLVMGSLTLVAILAPLASEDPRAADRSRAARLAADTLRSAQRVRRSAGALATAESLWTEATRGPVAPARPSRPEATPGQASSGFAATIETARRLRTVTAWLAVAERPEVSSGPRMRSLADTLRTLAARRDSLATGPERERQLAALTQRISRIGYTIVAIAENRRLDLDVLEDSASVARPPVPAPRAATTARPDTVAVGALLRSARDSAAAARRTHDSLRMALQVLDSTLAAAPARGLADLTPAIALGTLLMLGLLVRFGAALSRQVRSPTLANGREAESLAGVPVVATVRDALLDGPARFRPSGVDPFRMLYLGLTATGTRARTALVTGRDADIAAAAGARLAIAAAADHRATLVVDLDPARIAVARVLRERAEPGLTDALAGAFRWKEVARPIGSSDGLPITLLPAGTERDDLAVGEALDRIIDEFNRFRAAFELTIVVGPPGALDLADRLVGTGPLLLASSTGDTPVERFAAECEELRRAGRRLHGVILWDTARPSIPSRAELAALVSKRKGRTPGGSFEAVRRAIRNGGAKG